MVAKHILLTLFKLYLFWWLRLTDTSPIFFKVRSVAKLKPP